MGESDSREMDYYTNDYGSRDQEGDLGLKLQIA